MLSLCWYLLTHNNVLLQAGINTGPELSFTMLAEGMSPGHCVIRVTVTAVDENYSLLTQEKLTAEISLMVSSLFQDIPN